MTRSKFLILSVLSLVAVAVVSVQWGPRSDAAAPEDAEAEAAVQLTVAMVEPERIVLASEYSGRVAAGRRVEIRPQVGGLILERHVEEGTRVSAGDVLFRIDPAPLKADLAVAEAALARALTAEAHARRAAERSDSLLATNTVSLQANEAAHNELELAKAGVAEARTAVERKRLDLDFATLRTPIDGYVAAGLAEIGGLVSVGGDTALAVVQDLETVNVDLRLPEGDLDAVLTAAEDGLGAVTIHKHRGASDPLTGTLKSSDVIVDQGTGYVSVRVEAANPGLALLPGMFVRASLPYGVIEDALLVPEDAVLRTSTGGAQLAIVSVGGEATRRDVELGARVGNRVVVASGLKPGEIVAIRGQNRVPAGASVAAETRSPDATPTDTQS
ncbi:efflux transporter periplasmic adaptor subunit [Rhodovulum viride]|uniref:Efflux transporter periplasmic adaptor subunit n=1 Tax=Rhodovulum viride TaxID=1231134 RepID=A0ABX9DB41_9RHOB|nr:efflux RND transporter periplasmic adaptor subunit [Rhodovulum viride]RAP39549.1 efflux transporter periplasmic adaptor subunit [Rhodovulum viride]